MSDHSFNPFLAKKYGIVEAILINNFVFWTRTNAAKPEEHNNFFDERFWVFGTPEYFANYFHYLSPRQIKYALNNLFKSGALLKGNYNKKGYDQTKWYALSDQILFELNLDKTCLKPATELIGQNCPMDRTKLSDGLDKIVRPIPDTKPDTKENKKLTNCEDPEKPSSSSFIFSETIDKNILNQKLQRDTRTDEEFLKEAENHVEHHSDKQHNRLKRANALVKLLKQMKTDNIIFYVSEPSETKIVKKQETQEERLKRWALEREMELKKRNS